MAWVVLWVSATIILMARPVWAQSPLAVSGDVFADVKRFSGDSMSLPLDGTAFGAGARIGTTLASQWTIELGVDAGRLTTTIRDLTILPLASPVRRQTRTRNQLTAIEAVVGFHSRASGRVQLGYLGGLTLLHVIRKTDMLVGGVPQPISNRTTIDNVAAATLGFEVRVSFSRHVAVVPEVRTLAFTLSGAGPSGFAIRPGMAVRWSF